MQPWYTDISRQSSQGRGPYSQPTGHLTGRSDSLCRALPLVVEALHVATPFCSENLYNSQGRGPALL